MKVFFGIVFFCHLGKKEILRLQLVLVYLATLQHQPRLLEDYISAVCLHGSETGFGSLVVVPARTRATELQGCAVAVGEKGEGKLLVAVRKLIGVALGPDPCNGNRHVPHNPHMTPAGSHGVIVYQISCCNQHPVLINKFKQIVCYFRGLDDLELIHGI